MKTYNPEETMRLCAAAIAQDPRVGRCRFLVAHDEDWVRNGVPLSALGATVADDTPLAAFSPVDVVAGDKASVAKGLAQALAGKLAMLCLSEGVVWPRGFENLPANEARKYLLAVGETATEREDFVTFNIAAGKIE